MQDCISDVKPIKSSSMMIKLNLSLLHQIEHIFQIHLQPPFKLEILIFPFPPRQKILVLHFPATCLRRSMSLMFAGLQFEDSVIFATTHYRWHKNIVCTFVLSKLEYCNSLLSSCPNQLLNKLQKVLNSAARLVFKARKQEHIKPLLQKLHWLPLTNPVQNLNPVLQFFL